MKSKTTQSEILGPTPHQRNGSLRMPALDPEPDLSGLITEDDTPLDSTYAEKDQRLLTEPLYSSWRGPGPGRPFLALANVGYFYSPKRPALVPDMMLGLDVQPAGDLLTKRGHSYYEWLVGKPPDVIIEIVSDRRGGEETTKLRRYALLNVPYYVIHDPRNVYKHGILRAFACRDQRFEPTDHRWFSEVGLGLTLWDGVFETCPGTWLRWCDQAGKVIPTGAENAAAEKKKADRLRRRTSKEKHRADNEQQRANNEQERADRLAAQLRALGIEPNV